MFQKQKRGSKETIPNSNLGKEAISQAISALENWRFNYAHHYWDICDTQVQITESKPSRQPRDMMNQSGLRPHRLSKPLAPHQVHHARFLRECLNCWWPLSQTHTQRWSSSTVHCGAFWSSPGPNMCMLGYEMLPCCCFQQQQLSVVVVPASSVGQTCSCLRSPWMMCV